jgi:3-methyladenine DNA glycosylase AlkD
VTTGSPSDRAERVLAELRSLADPAQLAGMARFGIATDRALGGIGMPRLRRMGRDLGPDHQLADALWATGVHEARMLAAFVDDPDLVTAEQMERWAGGFDSWDLCDTVCGSLFDRTPFAHDKAVAWSGREEEFVKRAGFATMAWLAVHDREAGDDRFLAFLPHVERGAGDDRKLVRKAVSWALRQIGKRNARLNAEAVACADRIRAQGSRSARWVATDAIRELSGDAVRERLGLRS